MKTSNEIGNLASALVAVQANLPTVPKAASGYGYRYATLDDVVELTRDLLTNNGLSFVQMPSQPSAPGLVALTTRLMHSSGEWIEDTMELQAPLGKNINDAQSYGSGLTYARRYAYTAMLGIVADEDTDGTAPPRQRTATKPTTNGTNGDSRGPASPAAQAKRDSQRPSRDIFTLADDAKLRRQFHAVGAECYGPEWDTKRKKLIATWGHESSNDLTIEQAQKLIDGMKAKLNS